MSVKRLEWQECDVHNCHCDIVESKDGDMVNYEDYTALETEHKAAMLTISAIMEMLGASEAGSISEQVAALLAENAALKDDYLATPALKRMGWPKTPATDSAIENIQAQGVDMAINHLTNKFEGTGQIGVPVMALEWLAAELRKDPNND